MNNDNWPLYPKVWFKHGRDANGMSLCQFRTTVRKLATDGRWYKQQIMEQYLYPQRFDLDSIQEKSMQFHSIVYNVLILGTIDLNEAHRPLGEFDGRGRLYELDPDQRSEEERLADIYNTLR